MSNKVEATYHGGEYTPDEGRVRYAATEPHGVNITGAEFDRFVAKIKAEAWEKGKQDSWDFNRESMRNPDVRFPINPYGRES